MNNYELINAQRAYYNTHETLNYTFRKNQLLNLKASLLKYEDEINQALLKDLNKSSAETFLTEVGCVLSEITFALNNLKKFMKPKKVKTPFSLFKGKSYTVNEPYGVCLIISPWNYPINLTFSPLIGAIASGNTAIIKPSELSVNTSDVISKIIKETFKENYIACVLGDKEVSSDLLNNKFDLIFFTGSTKVGKIILEQASKNLTKTILELGGKSPCIVTESADLKLSAKRIAFGKIINAGQTCVAPDYILIDEKVKEEFLKYFIEYLDTLIDKSTFPKCINQASKERLESLIIKEKVIYSNDSFFTVMDNVTFEDAIMQSEIFGPIMPIITYSKIQDVVSIINSHDKPLALYLFTKDKYSKRLIINNVSFGGASINDTVMHIINPNLPFGGVGASGMGSYHGMSSFEAFSHKKSIYDKSNLVDIKLRYMPYSDKKMKIIKRIMK